MTSRARTEPARALGRAAEPRTPVWNPGLNPPAMSRTTLARQTPPVLEPDFDEPEPRPARLRRRLLFALLTVLLAVAVLAVGQFVRADDGDRIVVPVVSARPAAAVPTPKATPSKKPVGSSGTFAYVAGFGPIVGSRGPIHRFKIAVEKPAGDAIDFANQVNRTLGDRRSWIASHRFRFQRVPESAHAEFIVYLASARTSERMCRTGGLETDGFTSCRVPRKVIINADRWAGAVRDYGAPLATYRAYAINHEVGHQLGHGHQRCPGKGKVAPVMMQQTYGLKGCTANSWPYP
ncbi:hypothetical protein BJ973_006568 [Actinoplanes tereljensis]|uniref:DUF3152 domain-containing protein n=1 Tax=Paractinoplanes tereljensis TaxID=571912 RepID=A0A919NJA7_9ACTN|nr:DUF3152 domain-containing protein [Actinoplanes tereljensis]GIF19523.1 hypothetical protein Ate02nite_22530 [Actinoplanes tereljensis]